MEFKSDDKKTWLEDENGKQIALLDHPEVRPGVVNLVHTEVDPSLGGQGIAGKITQAVAERLREKGIRAYFAGGDLSSDNAIGTALLGSRFLWD